MDIHDLYYQQNGHNANQNVDLVELVANDSLSFALSNSDPCGDKFRGFKNVTPDIMRPSLRILPNTKSSLSSTSLPFGVLIQPFDDIKIPCLGEVIERCRGCKAYMNPYCTFLTPRMYRCPMCHRNNEISEATRAALTENNEGLVSLNANSVDYIASDEYQISPPTPPTFLFAFDVSRGAVSSGYLRICSETMKNNLERLSFNPRTMIGFVFFGSVVSVVSINQKSEKPMLLVVRDLSDYLKLPNVLINCHQYFPQLVQVIEDFPNWFSEQDDCHCSFGYVLGFSQLVLKSYGGRITVFINQLPDVEPGRIPLRVPENPSRPTTNDFSPLTTFYKDMAISLWEIRVTVDLFVVGGQSVDLPTIGQVARLTGGTIFYYSNFHTKHNFLQCEHFKRDLSEYLGSDYGYNALVRVRISRGMEFRTFIGNMFMNGTDFFRVNYFRPDFSFSVIMDVGDEFSYDSAFIQTALFYHNSHSELHISVHTLKVQLMESIPRVLLTADQHATSLIVARLLAHKALTCGTGDFLKLLGNSIYDILKVSRDPNIFGGSLSMRVPICRSISLLPYLLFSLLTHTTFMACEMSLDERYAAFCRVLSVRANTVMAEISPMLYDVTQIGKSCFEDSDGSYFSSFGPPLALLYSNMAKSGLYMLDMGSMCYLLARCDTPSDVLFDFFGVCEYKDVPEGLFVPGGFRNWNSFGLGLAMGQLSTQRKTRILFFVFKDNELGHTEFVGRMKCDRTRSCQSYIEYINALIGEKCK